jgi:exosortase
LFAAALVVLMLPTVTRLWQAWESDPSYSHGYLVLPLALYLGWLRYRQAGPPDPAAGNLHRALAAIVIAGVFHFAAVVLVWTLLDWVTIFFLVRGFLIGLGGGDWAAHFTVPLLFLFFMFPLPMAWTTYLAIWLQDIVARFSTWILEPFFLVVREGKAIRIEGVSHPLIVAHECSGVRQLIMFAALAVFLGEWSQRPWWGRLLLLAAALPISILANSLRVVMMAVGSVWFGLNWINTGLHDVPAYLGVPLGCLLFIGVHAAIGRFVRKDPPQTPAAPLTSPKHVATSAAPREWVLAGAVGALIGLTFLLKAHLAAKSVEGYASLREPLAQLPETFEVGDQVWHGATPPSINDLLPKLDFRVDDVLLRDYRSSQGGAFTIYAVYSKTAGDRYHHPEHCIRDAQGGTEILSARRRVSLDSTGKHQAQFMSFQIGWGKVTNVYYWHYTFLPPPDPSATLLQALHASMGRTAPSLTLEVFTNQTEPAALAALERDVLPRLDALLYEHHLPESAKCGCQRFPVVILRY